MGSSETSPLQNGAVLGRYKVLRELGRGAMAIVYLAQESGTHNMVALKMLLPCYEKQESYVNRFINEARAAAALSHPNIIEALDIGFDQGIHFYCMEYVDGCSLQELIRHNETIPLKDILDIAIGVASALEYGWSRHGLTHGDIKPENIMLTSGGIPKLADFGLANMRGHERTEADIILTPHYAAPELIQGLIKTGDCRTDIYAFGATFYHVISKKELFPGGNVQEVLDKQVHENPEPLNIRCPDIPPQIAKLIGEMLCKNPAERPQDWSIVHEELLNIRQTLFGEQNQPAKQNVETEAEQEADIETQLPLPGDSDGKKAYRKLLLFIVVSSVALLALGIFIVALGISRYEKRQKEAEQAQIQTTKEVEPAVEVEEPEECVGTSPAPKVETPEKKESAALPQTTPPAPAAQKKKAAPKAPQQKSKQPAAKKPQAKEQPKAPAATTPKPQFPEFPPVPGNFTLSLSDKYKLMEKNYEAETETAENKTVEAVRMLERCCRNEYLIYIKKESQKILNNYTLKLNTEDRKKIEALQQKASDMLPESQMEQLEKEAHAYLHQKRYEDALTCALIAKARYNSKNREQIEAALEALAKSPKRAANADLLLPFTQPLMPWEYYLLCKSPDYLKFYSSEYAISIIKPLAELYLGDWSSSTELKRLRAERKNNKKIREQLEALPVELKAAQGFAESLINEFADEKGFSWSWLTYVAKPKNERCSAETVALTASAALIFHQSPKGKNPLEIQQWKSGMVLTGSDASRRTLAYLLYAVYTENQAKDQLSSLLNALKKEPQSFGFKEVPSFAQQPSAAAALPAYDNAVGWAQLRAWIASASTPKGLDAVQDEKIKMLFSREAKQWPVQGGETIYAWLLNRVAFLLASRDLNGAIQLAEYTLSINAICLIPYYARIQALDAGLLYLAKKSGAAKSVLENLQNSTIINNSTYQIINCIDKGEKEVNPLFEQIKFGKNCWFSYAWIKYCQEISRKQQKIDLEYYKARCKPHPYELKLLNALNNK